MKKNRSVDIHGPAVGNIITTGDRGKVEANIEAKFVRTALPPSGTLDLSNELTQIRDILQGIGGEHAAKISRALDDAADEAEKPEPEKDEIGIALNRALQYAEKSNGFAEEVAKLAPHVSHVVSWLGTSWQQLLPFVGLSG